MNFTQAALNALPLPAPGQRAVYRDEGGPQSVHGLQIRITSNGVRTFSVLKRVSGGAPERRTIGRWPEVSIDQARKIAKAIIAQLAVGETAKKEAKPHLPTLAEALREYVEKQTRERDSLPLKERTKADYLAMVTPGRLTAKGKRTKGGLLASLADTPLSALSAEAIRTVHKSNLAERGERQAAYAMQVLRAVLNFHGVEIAGNPFSRKTPKVARVIIPKTRDSDPELIKGLYENLKPWWQALGALEGTEADYLRFLALTGCRPGEPLRVPVADCTADTVRLRDTKNRTDHIIRLSTQAAEIVQRQVEGKAATDRLFQIVPAAINKVAHELAAATGIPFVPKTLRAVFASIAEELVSASTLKRLMNHKSSDSNITDAKYVRKLDSQLRAGWQAVADFITN